MKFKFEAPKNSRILSVTTFKAVMFDGNKGRCWLWHAINARGYWFYKKDNVPVKSADFKGYLGGCNHSNFKPRTFKAFRRWCRHNSHFFEAGTVITFGNRYSGYDISFVVKEKI